MRSTLSVTPALLRMSSTEVIVPPTTLSRSPSRTERAEVRGLTAVMIDSAKLCQHSYESQQISLIQTHQHRRFSEPHREFQRVPQPG